MDATHTTQDSLPSRSSARRAGHRPLVAAALACLIAVAPAAQAASGLLLVSVVPTSSTQVTNCIPFGSSAFGASGFVYRNVPSFSLPVGGILAFDLGARNDVDIHRDVYLSNLDYAERPTGWVRIAPSSQTPLNPRGDEIVGNYELEWTATAPFSHSAGGLAVAIVADLDYPDPGCEQVLVSASSTDSSGLFAGRFFNQPTLPAIGASIPTVVTGAPAIGGFKVYSGGPPVEPILWWPTPEPITYGTPLSEEQLKARSLSLGASGTFTYDPPIGTILEAGTQQAITVRYAPDAAAERAYASTTLTRFLDVERAPQTITLDAPSSLSYGAPPLSLASTASSGLPVELTSGTPDVCAVSGGSVTVTDVGDCVLVGNQPGNHNWLAAPEVTRTFAINQGVPLLAWSRVSHQVPTEVSSLVDAGIVPIAPTGIEGSTLVTDAAGKVVDLTAALPGGENQVFTATFTPTGVDAKRWATVSASVTVSVLAIPQTITIPVLPAQVAYGGGDLSVAATGGASGRPVVAISQTPQVCTVNGTSVTLTGTGTCSLILTQDGDALHLPADPVTVTMEVLARPTTLEWPDPAQISYGTALSGQTLNATVLPSAAQGTIAYELADGTSAAGEVLDVGTHPVRAVFSPATGHDEPTETTRALTVVPAEQSIHVEPLGPLSWRAGPQLLVAEGGGSELPVTFTTTSPHVCKIHHDTVVPVRPGVCEVIAAQAGDANHLAAPSVTQRIPVSWIHPPWAEALKRWQAAAKEALERRHELVRERATCRAVELRADRRTRFGAITRVARQYGVKRDRLWSWVVQAEQRGAPECRGR